MISIPSLSNWCIVILLMPERVKSTLIVLPLSCSSSMVSSHLSILSISLALLPVLLSSISFFSLNSVIFAVRPSATNHAVYFAQAASGTWISSRDFACLNASGEKMTFSERITRRFNPGPNARAPTSRSVEGNVSSASDSQSRKAVSLMTSKPSGRATSVRFLHPAKALCPIALRLFGRVTVLNFAS